MSDIPMLQSLVDWANVGVVVALAASLLTGGASIFLSKRLGALKDEQATREKQASAEKLAQLEKENAEAELRLTELRRWRNMKEVPRWQFLGDLPEYLRGKQTGVAEVLYAPADDREPNDTARTLADMLVEVGWKITRVKEISADDPSQILNPNPEALPPDMPMLQKVGGAVDFITFWGRNSPTSTARLEAGEPGAILAFGLRKTGLKVLGFNNERFPEGFVRIVVAQKD